MAALDISTFDAALKQLYDDRRVRSVVFKNNPFHAMVMKYSDFVGRNMPLVLTFGNPQGRSSIFATAQSNKTAGNYTDFLLTRVKDYGLTSIELETIQATSTDRGAFLKAATAEIDGILNQVARSISTAEYGNGGGAIGQQVSGGIGGTTITLANPTDATNFEKGMFITASATDGTSGSVRTGRVQLVSLDRSAGTLTADVDWDTGITGFANDDFLFVEGDFGVKLTGLDGWLPAVAPSGGDNFFGVDRSQDPDRLAGIRHDGSAQTIEEALIDGASKINALGGGMPDFVFINPRNVRELVKLLDSRIEYNSIKPQGLPESAEFGFRSIMLQADHGMVQVVSDRNAPVNTAFMLQLDTWVLASLGEAPKILEGLNQRFIWDANADSVEIRTGYYAQMGCVAPGYNGRITLPPAAGT